MSDWKALAACRGRAGPDNPFFYEGDGDRGAGSKPGDQKRTREAKAICRGCEVREECLQAALASREPFGVWGGLTASERRAILRARGVPTLERDCAWFRCGRAFLPANDEQKYCCQRCKWCAHEQKRRDERRESVA